MAVLAVDPTSGFSGGAILGDKVGGPISPLARAGVQRRGNWGIGDSRERLGFPLQSVGLAPQVLRLFFRL